MSAWGFDGAAGDDRDDERPVWLRGELPHDVGWGFEQEEHPDVTFGFPHEEDEATAALADNHAPATPPPHPHPHPTLEPITAPPHEQLPNHLYPLWGTISDDEDEETRHRQTHIQLTPPSDTASAEFVTLEDSTDDEEGDTNDMPAANRPCRNNASRSSVVDLTSAPSPTETNQARGIKRRRSTDGGEGRAPKRGTRRPDQEIEQLDLTGDAPSAEEELLQKQQEEAIKAQQEEEDQGPQRIGKRQCIICMEPYTNATATACGHFYCHECLTQALLVGERNSDRGTGACPNCRKPISRRKKHDIIPIAFMKKSQFAKNQSKRTDIL